MNKVASALSYDLLRQFDVPAPRYTSYPTADRFTDEFANEQYGRVLTQRRSGPAGLLKPLSVYVHIPFCESLCYYCACNKIVTNNHARAAEYLRYLGREIDLHLGRIGLGQSLSQLHMGGGSPTFLSDAELTGLMAQLRRSWTFTPDAECTMEVDPRTVSERRIGVLGQLGFNRLTFGVQDFDPRVQQALNRVQSCAQVSALVRAARDVGVASINIDLLYGLPYQTLSSFTHTLEQVLALRPDRAALYGYAHLPRRFSSQRRIASAALPTPEQRLDMLSVAMQCFVEAGYVYIGVGQFALPGDALATAKRQGRLHRNFQGYSTQADRDLIGLGVSAIGHVGASYSQNARTLDAYYALLEQGQFAVVRGWNQSRDDLVRRAVIMSLMCHGQVIFESIELAYLVDFRAYFAQELVAIEGLCEQGLVEMDATGFQLTPEGGYLVRAVAMVFDRYLQADRSRARFSRII